MLFRFVKALTSFYSLRKDADVTIEGQFLVRQIYEDAVTYNLIGAAVNLLRKLC